MKTTEEQDIEGLEYLRWSMFDSPDSPGSGYRFMEREPVMILDAVVKSTRLNPKVLMGYATPQYAKDQRLISTNSHRIGKAILIEVKIPRIRMKYVKYLLKHGAHTVALDRDKIYFDTDRQKTSELRLWC